MVCSAANVGRRTRRFSKLIALCLLARRIDAVLGMGKLLLQDRDLGDQQLEGVVMGATRMTAPSMLAADPSVCGRVQGRHFVSDADFESAQGQAQGGGSRNWPARACAASEVGSAMFSFGGELPVERDQLAGEYPASNEVILARGGGLAVPAGQACVRCHWAWRGVPLAEGSRQKLLVVRAGRGSRLRVRWEAVADRVHRISRSA